MGPGREHDVCAAGIDKEGLWDAAETVIRAIQAELQQATEPLDRLWAMQLDIAGHLARLALYDLSGDTWQRAKEVEARQRHLMCRSQSASAVVLENHLRADGERENAQPATRNVRGAVSAR